MSIRYGARPPEERRNREVEAVQRQIWTKAVTVVFETDPAAITAVLPPPLEPSRLSVFFLLGVVALGPLWVLFRPSPLATRVRDAGIVAALVIFFAGNLLMVVRQVPIYLQEGIRGKSPAVASTTPSP